MTRPPEDPPASRAGDALQLSFEVFPPKRRPAQDRLLQEIRALEPLAPRFLSVTYGAGGGTRETTLATALRVGGETAITPAVHLTCVGAARHEVDAVARDFWAAGLRHIVAVRGDPPGGGAVYRPHPRGYAYAADLVAGLKRIADFEISVAAYPELHPEASTAAQDLDALKRKLDAGATRAITQFFFDTEIFLRFVERMRAAGIEAPIVAGIMPIADFARVQGFARRCAVTIPPGLAARFAAAQQDATEQRRLAIAAAQEQCEALRAAGQRDFHIYTLNDPRLAAAVCEPLREPDSLEDAAARPRRQA